MSTNIINRVIQYIDANISNTLTPDMICEHVQCSRKNIDRKFKNERGETLSQYLRHKKAEMAAKEVASGQNTIEFIANKYNYCGSSFSRLIKRLLGYRPKDIALGNVRFSLSNDEGIIITESDLAEITTALDALQAKGVFKYQFSTNQKYALISEVNFNLIYEFFRSRPTIPLPAKLFRFLKKEYPNTISTIIAFAYFEMLLNDYDISKMRWRLEDLMDLLNNPSEEFESILIEVDCFYDLDTPVHDKQNNLLWFHIQDSYLDKLAKIIKTSDAAAHLFENDSNQQDNTTQSNEKTNNNYRRSDPFNMEIRIQKAINKLPPVKRGVFRYIIANMDEAGCCTLHRDKLAKALGCKPEDLDMEDIANTLKNLMI